MIWTLEWFLNCSQRSRQQRCSSLSKSPLRNVAAHHHPHIHQICSSLSSRGKDSPHVSEGGKGGRSCWGELLTQDSSQPTVVRHISSQPTSVASLTLFSPQEMANVYIACMTSSTKAWSSSNWEDFWKLASNETSVRWMTGVSSWANAPTHPWMSQMNDRISSWFNALADLPCKEAGNEWAMGSR